MARRTASERLAPFSARISSFKSSSSIAMVARITNISICEYIVTFKVHTSNPTHLPYPTRPANLTYPTYNRRAP